MAEQQKSFSDRLAFFNKQGSAQIIQPKTSIVTKSTSSITKNEVSSGSGSKIVNQKMTLEPTATSSNITKNTTTINNPDTSGNTLRVEVERKVEEKKVVDQEKKIGSQTFNPVEKPKEIDTKFPFTRTNTVGDLISRLNKKVDKSATSSVKPEPIVIQKQTPATNLPNVNLIKVENSNLPHKDQLRVDAKPGTEPAKLPSTDQVTTKSNLFAPKMSAETGNAVCSVVNKEAEIKSESTIDKGLFMEGLKGRLIKNPSLYSKSKTLDKRSEEINNIDNSPSKIDASEPKVDASDSQKNQNKASENLDHPTDIILSKEVVARKRKGTLQKFEG